MIPTQDNSQYNKGALLDWAMGNTVYQVYKKWNLKGEHAFPKERRGMWWGYSSSIELKAWVSSWGWE